ncbi:MAG: hypothetical protein KF855_03785 [Acidobacteria bacterium]|nr:hypothetical protein [Acidobacteriota bacterium]
MLIPHQKIYTPPIRNRPVSSILYFRAGVTGTIREVAIYPGGSTTFGNWYFNVRLNGDPLFSGSNRPKVNGTNPIIKGGLNVPCTQGDTIVLDLEQAGSGSIAGPTTFIVTIESAG